jgi:hypothetical protein
MPLKTLGPIGPRAVGERVKKNHISTYNLLHMKDCLYIFSVNVHLYTVYSASGHLVRVFQIFFLDFLR